MASSPSAASSQSARRWLYVAVVLLLLAVVVFFARPVYLRLKAWRSQNLVKQSTELLERGQWSEARTKAHAAVLLTPNDPAAMRAMAQVLSRGTNQPAVAAWQRLLQSGHATPDDRRSFVEHALRAGANSAAADELDKLVKESPSHPVNLWLAAQLFATAGDREQAIYYAARARLNNPTNQQYQLFLASLRFDSAQEDQRFAAHSNVWGIASEAGPLSLDALGFLARRRELTSEQRLRVAALLRKHPLKTLGHELLALTLEIAAAPTRRDELLDAAVATHKASDPDTRVQVAVWLNQNQEFERTLRLLPLEEAIKRKEFLLAHADALGGLSRWEELKKIFESNKLPLEQSYAQAFLARCDKELGQAASAEQHWREAIRTAERHSEQLMWVALFAEQCNEFSTAKTALRSLISFVENPRPAFQVLMRVTERTGPTTELRDLLGEMSKRWPEEVAYRNDFAYLNALLNTDTPKSLKTAEALVRQHPENLTHRTTLALALFRQQDFVRAMGAYAGRQYRWEIAFPSQRAVYAAVLAANGRDTEARELARAINSSQLRPEELQLIAALR